MTAISAIKTTSSLTFNDFFGAMKARWAINRNNYKVAPGLYSLGNPDENTSVFVTANYKLSFDTLRKNLSELNAWILVLDTKGVNVWCAAGKGTFGTEELINKIESANLANIVSHKKLILPQLGAVGIAAHEIKQKTGFSVKYGPVEAKDIKKYLANNYISDSQMRTVEFNTIQRLKLVPVELVGGLQQFFIFVAAFIILSGINKSGYSLDIAFEKGIRSALFITIAYLSGTIICPLLIPIFPFRRFSLNGILIGLILSTLTLFIGFSEISILEKVAWIFMIPAINAYVFLNFTGCTTYTSLSGVLKEMKTFIPIIIIIFAIGFISWIISNFWIL
jgi:hypothetical protein